jgi:acyl-CoA synthetase (NDP forming)
MYEALFKQLGIIRANSFDELLDIPAALATDRKLRGNRVAILTSTGGAGTLVSDALGVSGFETPAPDEITAGELRALQDGDHAALDRNPIDVTLAGLKPDLLKGAITSLLRSQTYDALVVIVGASGLAMPELMSNAINSCLGASDKPVIAYISPHAPKIGALLMQGGVPAFSSPESISAALGAMLHVSQCRTPHDSTKPAHPVFLDDMPTGVLNEAQAKQLFSKFGIACANEIVVNNVEQATQAAQALGNRVVLKILSSEILHKSDMGGVAVNLTAEQIGARLEKMKLTIQAKAGFTPDTFLVQEMVSGGTELILGMHRDPLGTALLLGMGGVTAELLKDTTMRLLPTDGGLSAEIAREMAMELKTWPLLDGYRGRPLADVDALVAAIVAFSEMVAQLGERLSEAEINPLFVLERGQGVKAADGIAVLNCGVHTS